MSTSDDIYQGTPAQSIFMSQLQRMINNERRTGIIDWLPDGRGFAIRLKQDFSDEVLPRYFGPAKFTSFTRRLKRWGFMCTSSSGEYRHDNFRRDVIFDLDCEAGHPNHLATEPSIPPRTLPLKKRIKWVSPAPSPLTDHPLSRHGSLSAQNSNVKLMSGMMRTVSRPSQDGIPEVQSSDVKSMPELRRMINRRKRKERGDDGAISPPAKKTTTYQTKITKSYNTLVKRMEVAQTLISMGRQGCPCHAFPCRTANRTCIEDFRLETPLHKAYTELEKKVDMEKPDDMAQQLKPSRDYSPWCDDDADFATFAALLDLDLSRDEGYHSQLGLCQLISDSRRVPTRSRFQ